MTARPRRQRWRASNPSNPEGFRNDRGRGKGRIAAPSEGLEAFARTLRICGCASERACMCLKGRITFPTLPFYKLSIKEYSLFNNLSEFLERKGLTRNLPHSFRSRKGVLGGRAAWSFRGEGGSKVQGVSSSLTASPVIHRFYFIVSSFSQCLCRSNGAGQRLAPSGSLRTDRNGFAAPWAAERQKGRRATVIGDSALAPLEASINFLGRSGARP